jgi:hypothetical protein
MLWFSARGVRTANHVYGLTLAGYRALAPRIQSGREGTIALATTWLVSHCGSCATVVTSSLRIYIIQSSIRALPEGKL